MVEFGHAIATITAMLGTLRPEDQACLAKLHHFETRVGCVGALGRPTLKHQVLDPVLHKLDIRVALVHMKFSLLGHQGGRNNAWVCSTDLEEEDVGQELQQNAHGK